VNVLKMDIEETISIQALNENSLKVQRLEMRLSDLKSYANKILHERGSLSLY